MPWPSGNDEITAIAGQLLTQTDRGAGIIGAALVEELLTDLLKARLIGGKAAMERLFSYEKNGPLASFSTKIDLSFSIGLIDAQKRDDLHKMRRIRNRFAHSLRPLDFSDPEIAAWCSAWASATEKTEAHAINRSRYMLCFMAMALTFGLQLSLFSQPLTAELSEAADHEFDEFIAHLGGDLSSLTQKP